MRDNQTVRDALTSFFVSKGLSGLGGVHGPAGQKVAAVMEILVNGIQDVNGLRQGRYYDSFLSITNQASSTLLTELVPYGGTMADALNIAGSVATAYVYGFFWGQ